MIYILIIMAFTPAIAVRDIFIKKLREAFPKLADYARRTGISPGGASKLASGKWEISLDKIKELAEFIPDCYPSDFFPPDWIRPSKQTENERMLACAIKIFGAYDETKKRYGDFASPETMGKILVMLMNDPEIEASPEKIDEAVKMLKAFNLK